MTQPNESNESNEANEAIKLAWFEIRYAAEQTAEAFRRFNREMQNSIKKEKENLRQREEEAKQRATEMEAEYQLWKVKRTRGH